MKIKLIVRVIMAAKKQKTGALQRLFGWISSESPQEVIDDGGGGYSNLYDALTNSGSDDPEDDADALIKELPRSRYDRYTIYDEMVKDPSVKTALSLHVAHALAPSLKSGEVVFIESPNDEDNEIVTDLRNTFKALFNEEASTWARFAGRYGCYYLRPYIKAGEGIVRVRCDHYTHPAHIREYEQAGRIIGYASTKYLPADKGGGLPLLEPWKIVPVKMPGWSPDSTKEPSRQKAEQFSLADEDFENEEPVETQNYGESLLETAYTPWTDLNEAILALNAARRASAKKDRFVGYSANGKNMDVAAKEMGLLAKLFKRKKIESARRSLKKGYVGTVDTTIYPMFASGAGGVTIQTEDSSADINAIEDVNFHVARLASALATDKSMIGFTDELSGGLGDGGFFRVSVNAARYSANLRDAVATAMERLCEIHVAAKFQKVFPEGEKPWRIRFNSLSSALEQEATNALETSSNVALSVLTLLQTADPEGTVFDAKKTASYLMTDMLGMEGDKFAELIKDSPPVDVEGSGEPPIEDDPVMDSATEKLMKQIFLEASKNEQT